MSKKEMSALDKVQPSADTYECVISSKRRVAKHLGSTLQTATDVRTFLWSSLENLGHHEQHDSGRSRCRSGTNRAIKFYLTLERKIVSLFSKSTLTEQLLLLSLFGLAEFGTFCRSSPSSFPRPRWPGAHCRGPPKNRWADWRFVCKKPEALLIM